ncbi:primosomal protein N' [Chlamydiales bacterium]|nr:primosomal protein N' [Chlamydiales bacterium]
MFVEVLLDQGLQTPLDYSIPESMELKLGMRVQVPLGRRAVPATVIKVKEETPHKARPVISLIHELPTLTAELFKLAQFISHYWCTPLQKVLKVMVPPGVKQNIQNKKITLVTPKVSLKELIDICGTLRSKAPKQSEVLDQFLKGDKEILLKNLSAQAVSALTKKGVLIKKEVDSRHNPLKELDWFPIKPKKLTDEQQNAFESIYKTFGSFTTHLLFGVTGSGKSEVYFQLIQKCLEEKKGVLFLVPEIALTEQLVEKLKTRFPCLALLHHRLSDGERNEEWMRLIRGETLLAIGARSAIFAPIQHLGLIIVDEEHESSYKQQDDMPCYHARDLSIVRAKFNQATVVLGSATPSLESYTHALSGKYHLHTLKKRPANIVLPKVHIVDMTLAQNGFFSDLLISGIKKRLDLGEQTILFLNRRGYNTSLFCTTCQKAIHCPNCSVALTFHKQETQLLCHQCGYESPPLKTCPECQKETMKYKGIGTEQVEKTLYALFESVRIIRMDGDTTKKKGSHEKLLKAFATGKADILIGTQMVSKGLNFPQVSLVGILNADHHLHIPDFRSSESAFQQITQVSGRSGRGALSGEVILQTHLNMHPTIINASEQNYENFYKDEIEGRTLFDFPPNTHLARLIFKGKEEQETVRFAKLIREHLIHHLPDHFTILPLTPCGFHKINHYFRYHFIIKGKSLLPFCRFIEKMPLPLHKSVKAKIDIDPLTTFF